MSADSHDKYSDILDSYPGPIPGHPPMSNDERAAQFAPFAALTGFDEEIDEAKEQSMIENS